MKTCSACKIEKPTAEFNKKGVNKFQPYCKPCGREKSRTRYAANGASHKYEVLKRNRRYRSELKAWVREIKEADPCMDCDTKFPWYVMDFDHVTGDKYMDVSLMISRLFAKAKIQEEIDKCEIVCSNCHRVRTFTRSGHALED